MASVVRVGGQRVINNSIICNHFRLYGYNMGRTYRLHEILIVSMMNKNYYILFQEPEKLIFNALLVVIALVEMGATIWHSVLCCNVLCYRRLSSVLMVRKSDGNSIASSNVRKEITIHFFLLLDFGNCNVHKPTTTNDHHRTIWAHGVWSSTT